MTTRRPGWALTSFRPGDDRLWVALGLALEVHCLPFDHSSVLRGHSELRKSCRRKKRWEHDMKMTALPRTHPNGLASFFPVRNDKVTSSNRIYCWVQKQAKRTLKGAK